MKLWIDDVRPAPAGWIWCKSVHEAKIHFCQLHIPNGTTGVTEISLDHDAGSYAFMGGDYIKLLDWLEEKTISQNWDLSKVVFHIHSANPVGRENMRRIIKKNEWREIF